MKWICVVLCCITLGAVMIDVWMFYGGTVQAQGGQTVYVQLAAILALKKDTQSGSALSALTLAEATDISTVKIKGNRVVGFSCTSAVLGTGPTCFVASAP